MGWIKADGSGNEDEEIVLPNYEIEEEEEEEETEPELHTCYYCDADVEEVEDLGGRSACEDCVATHTSCGRCDRITANTNIIEVIDVTEATLEWCQNCYENNAFGCDECGIIYDINSCYTTHDDCVICGRCREDNYFVCDNCDRLLHNDDYSGDGMCLSCMDEDLGGEGEDEDEENVRIPAHDANPFNYVAGAREIIHVIEANPTLPYMGIELEVSAQIGKRRNAIEAVKAAIVGTAFVKHDGSVTNGFEICSLPTLPDTHKANQSWFSVFDLTKELLLKDSYKANAGMHIHINRRAFNPTVLTRFISFIHSKVNEPFIVKIAERKSDRWCTIMEKDPTAHVARPDQKYQAVNLTKDRTVEVRIFASVVAKENFFKNIEFVQALFDYLNTMPQIAGRINPATEKPETNNNLHYSKFIEYVKANGEKYKYLADFIAANPIAEIVSPKHKVTITAM